MCTDKNNGKNNTNVLPHPSTPITVFLIAEKLLSLWLRKFQTFCLTLLIVLWKIERNYMSRLICVANLLEMDRKKIFFF